MRARADLCQGEAVGAARPHSHVWHWSALLAVSASYVALGPYANWYFLLQLAQIGRGFFDACVASDQIYERVVALLNMAAVPVLSNITIEV